MPNRKPVRIGIVGLGPRGRLSWMKNLLRIETCRVTALCDRVDALVGQAYREAGDPDIACFTDYGEMLEKADVDAVAIVTAPHDQPDLICRAMEAGKHAACEVSLTYDMDDLWRVVVAVERSGLKFQMAEQVMYHPFVKAWRRLVREGELGHVIFAQGQYLHGMTPDRFWVDSETGERIDLDAAADHPRAAKSRMWNWFPHPILYMATDLGPILTVLDDRVTRVTCMGTRTQSYYYEGIPASDIEVALMHTEKDTIVRMAVGFTYATPRDHHWWHLEGTKGKVETARSAEIYGGPQGVDTPKNLAGEFRRGIHAGGRVEVFSGRPSRGGQGQRAREYGLLCALVVPGRHSERFGPAAERLPVGGTDGAGHCRRSVRGTGERVPGGPGFQAVGKEKSRRVS